MHEQGPGCMKRKWRYGRRCDRVLKRKRKDKKKKCPAHGLSRVIENENKK